MIASADGKKMREGVRVSDMTSVVFGPYATQILADFGAEVIKVEAPGGEVYRYSAKPAATPGMAPGFHALNRGKKSLGLDLKNPADADTMRELLRGADVFIHNVREAAIEKLGFGYEAAKALSPALVYVQEHLKLAEEADPVGLKVGDARGLALDLGLGAQNV